MRIRHATIEYNLTEAATMLGISPKHLKQAVDTGHLQYYYRSGKNNYQFHEASLCTNRELLSQSEYLTSMLTAHWLTEVTTAPDVQEAVPLSTPSDE